MKTLLTQRELFFCPCSTVRAVDYEILWSNLSPQASVNISWHMGERNPHSLGAGLPLAKVSTTIPLHSKRNNEGKRFLRTIILTIWVLMALMCWIHVAEVETHLLCDLILMNVCNLGELLIHKKNKQNVWKDINMTKIHNHKQQHACFENITTG